MRFRSAKVQPFFSHASIVGYRVERATIYTNATNDARGRAPAKRQNFRRSSSGEFQCRFNIDSQQPIQRDTSVDTIYDEPTDAKMELRRMKTVATFLTAACTLGVLNAADIEPPDVYQAVRQVSQDIELVREVMGRPKLDAPTWVVEHAEPRHVYYQAQTLFRKVDRLNRQFTNEESTMPRVPTGEIEPQHVLQVIHAAQGLVENVREELGINYRSELPVREADREPKDVFRETVQLGRQLNLMLDRPIQPQDVYGQIELAATYVAGALTTDESIPVYGELPPFEPHKVPADVYRRVLECLGIAQDIGAQNGISVLQLNLRRELRRRDIIPSDVYDLATTVLAEVAYLTLTLDAFDVDVPPIERPKHVFPSHVYQMASMLQEELARLEAHLVR